MTEMVTNKYGILSSRPLNDLQCELYAFEYGLGPEQGGLGKVRHLLKAMKMLFPEQYVSPWTEWRMEGLCDYDFVSWAGSMSSGKSVDAAMYAMTWWAVAPLTSTVVLTSTTKGMIRKRIWKTVQKLYYQCGVGRYPGTLIDSLTTLRVYDPSNPKRRDDLSAIFAKAVAEGSVEKAAADIQGMHNDRVLVVIDEAPFTPEAIFETLNNLSGGTSKFQVIVIGNPSSRFDQHGRFSEPLNGWNSVSIDTDEWETTMKFTGKPGLCQRFDGAKCPNVLEGKPVYKGLLTAQQYENAIRQLDENSPKLWSQYRGFWPPEGTTRTVFTETMCIKNDAFGKLAFHSWSYPIAFLDQAFGGDRCILRFARLGDLESGRMGVQLGKIIEIKMDARSKDPIADQIVKRCKIECVAEGVSPDHFGFDATAGTGIAMYAIFSREWSSMVRQVQFGGAPSQLLAPGRENDPAADIYDRRVTELWFAAREFLVNGQLRGFDFDTVREFCARYYDDKKGKTVLETKDEMKLRFGRSPDLADAVVGLVDIARTLGAAPGTGKPTDTSEAWEKMAAQSEAANVAQYEPEELELATYDY